MHDDSRMRWSADVSVRLIFFYPSFGFPSDPVNIPCPQSVSFCCDRDNVDLKEKTRMRVSEK